MQMMAGVSMCMMVVMVMVMIVMMIMAMVVLGRSTGADALDMVVVARLGQAHLALEAQDLLAVLAHLAIHVGRAVHHLAGAVDDGVDHQLVVVEIGRLDELDPWKAPRHLVGVLVDATDQDAGEKKIGENDDPPEAKPRRMLEPGGDQREGHARIDRLAPAEAEPLP